MQVQSLSGHCQDMGYVFAPFWCIAFYLSLSNGCAPHKQVDKGAIGCTRAGFVTFYHVEHHNDLHFVECCSSPVISVEFERGLSPLCSCTLVSPRQCINAQQELAAALVFGVGSM